MFPLSARHFPATGTPPGERPKNPASAIQMIQMVSHRIWRCGWPHTLWLQGLYNRQDRRRLELNRGPLCGKAQEWVVWQILPGTFEAERQPKPPVKP